MEYRNASRAFAFLTFAAGAFAAYLMYRRGESPLSVAKSILLNPVGSLASELHTAATSGQPA